MTHLVTLVIQFQFACRNSYTLRADAQMEVHLHSCHLSNFPIYATASRWKVLLKSCPANSADVATFEEKLEYLLDLFSKQASPPQSPQRRPAQSGAEPEPVKQSHRSVSNGGTMGSGPSM